VLCRRRSRQVAPALKHFLRNKRQEWEEYRSQVTAFELRKSLPVL
jgi:glutamine synthetase